MNEAQLIKYLKESHYPDLIKAKNKYSRWDCIDNTNKLIIELKCRRRHYDTLLIEKKKYDAILNRANELGYTPLYINSTPKGVFSWDLGVQKIDWNIEFKHPATTAFSNRKVVSKEVGYLDLLNAEIL